MRKFVWQIAAKALPGSSTFNLFRLCHPERSEGPAVRRGKQVLRFAQDDNS